MGREREGEKREKGKCSIPALIFLTSQSSSCVYV